MGSLKISATPLDGLMLVETASLEDPRGRFTRLFCEKDYAPIRRGLHWTQINHSHTAQRGSVRGMHFQHPPSAEAKLIRCLKGRVFDVAVDLRAGSATFLRWHGVELREDNPRQIFIPEGYAHGFQTLTDDAELLYLHTAAWDQEREGRLRYDDPKLAIAWPLPVTQVSEKDRAAPPLTSAFEGIAL